MKSVPMGTLAALVAIVLTRPACADENLAKKSGCLECHSINAKSEKQFVGPSFHEIAARYRHDAHARDALIETVKQGGKNNWPEVSNGVPMPPFSPRLSDADIRKLVDWALSL